jgi:uncharacterized metal-binding protein
MGKKVLILPCSGIGKAFGSINRDATFRVVDELRPGKAETNCLSLLVMGDEDAKRQVQTSRCIAVDGCSLECSKKLIESVGGKVTTHYRVMDFLRKHRDLKPGSITFLDENGKKLSQLLAEEIAEKVDELEEEAE